jgi:hypothetical protein
MSIDWEETGAEEEDDGKVRRFFVLGVVTYFYK